MKKLLFILSCVAMMTFAAACNNQGGKDNDAEASDEPVPQIVGKWKSDLFGLEFKKNGTGVMILSNDKGTKNFTYSLQDTLLTLKYEDNPAEMTLGCVFEGDTFTLLDDFDNATLFKRRK